MYRSELCPSIRPVDHSPKSGSTSLPSLAKSDCGSKRARMPFSRRVYRLPIAAGSDHWHWIAVLLNTAP
jgi:hypothetical protein